MSISVRAYGVAQLLDQAPPGIKILSLDCFDTLLWRNANLPVDVFAALDLPGGGVETRIWAEKQARSVAAMRDGRDEVSIAEIYAQLRPAASDAERAALIDAEIAAEEAHCYGFEPTVALMRDAKARGLQVVIVSDTYLAPAQLRNLIARIAGEDVAALIDRVFCSCTFGVPKAGGLFTHVLPELGVSPDAILHVGDNPEADGRAPAKLGIHTAHLVQFDEESEQRLRLEAVAACMIEPASRVTAPVHQIHRARVALREQEAGAAKLGHDVLGPIFASFAEWLHEEAAAREAQTGKPTKLLFLLRDGYLPAAAYLARYPEDAPRVAQVEISRLTAAMAGMVDVDAIERHLLPELPTGEPRVFARQFQFDKGEAARLAKLPRAKFAREVLKPRIAAGIVARSARFAGKLRAHLASHGVAQGDSVMLVDLGYNGSVQNLIEPMLRQTMDLDLCGRYLLLRELVDAGLDKKGFIDRRHHPLKFLHALCESIAVVEQLCTLSQGSVVDYRPDGSPMREKAGVKQQQSAARDAVQAACLDWASRDAAFGVTRLPISDTMVNRARAAAASLTRLLFLPVQSEIGVLGDFQHDVNLGSNDHWAFMDPAAAETGLRRRGIFYIKNALRPYLPGELRDHGLPLNLSLFASRCHGLDLRKSDFDVGAVPLPVMLMDGTGEHVVIDVDAVPTIDGWYQALIPVGAGQLTAGIQLGRLAEWVQLDEIVFQPVESFMAAAAKEKSISAHLIAEGMDEAAPGLMHCTGGDAAFLLVPPPAVRPDGALLLSVVFRPVIGKAQLSGQVRAAA
jgi:FMN phosphatase YigB (HAD superfamily)